MSRGHGKWQRQILETLEQYPDGFYLASLATNLNENRALLRAVYKLAEEGLVLTFKYDMGMYHCRTRERKLHGKTYRFWTGELGGPKIVLVPPGAGDCKLERDVLEQRYHEIRSNRTKRMKKAR